MTATIDKYNDDIKKLEDLGLIMSIDMSMRDSEEFSKLKKKDQDALKKYDGSFEKRYQEWYTESHTLIKQILPDRLAEFETLYKSEGKRKEINAVTYTVQDWLNGTRTGVNDFTGERNFNDLAIATMRFQTQLGRLKSVKSRFKSSLFEIKQLVQADLFDSELETARELLKNGFLRGAGAIAGVVLEKHLSEVCSNHSIKVKKKNPSISDFNDLLKNNDVTGVPNWRFIQRLGDLRNLCDHNKKREPEKDEVEELISGVEKVSKTIF